jgi:DNA-binding XRE family transcriptional regulator
MNFKEYKAKAFKDDPELHEEYKALAPKYKLVSQIIRLRTENDLTQGQLAEKIGSTQRVVSNLENGDYNPSLEFLAKLAAGLGKELEIIFK